MGYRSLSACINDLEKNGHLVRIRELVDPNLEMAAIHLRVFESGGPAILYENVRGSKFPAVSNLFGTLERSEFIFRDSIQQVQNLVGLRNDPLAALKSPLKYAGTALTAFNALPLRINHNQGLKQFSLCRISDLPQILNWPMDGGPFVTLPQVYTEDIEKPGVFNANVGMYRIQLGGNAYEKDKEVGLHYQLHRGIGVHQTKSNLKGQPLKVSVFVGGPPSHSMAAVMPLPEGLSELTFAGALGNRRFRYFYDKEGFCISADADFIITGTVYPSENKPEGPFGDHLGYYSLEHPFPVMKVHNVYHKNGAIWPFTVVGRPPQEDTSFGALIHHITGPAIPREIPGLKEINAVDAAGVHPLLLAIGSERYTPYLENKAPQELLTIANHILGKNQLSLAKYLFITTPEENLDLSTHDIPAFFEHLLKRIDLTRDLHFHTRTTIDTLDYSGSDLNSGSKVVFAATGNVKRELSVEEPSSLSLEPKYKFKVISPGILAMQIPSFESSEVTANLLKELESDITPETFSGFPLIILCDDAAFISNSFENFLWVTFTRSNPSHDIYGFGSFTENKHWGCTGSVLIDARRKPHHAPELVRDAAIEEKVDRLFEKGASLYGLV